VRPSLPLLRRAVPANSLNEQSSLKKEIAAARRRLSSHSIEAKGDARRH
jgi:hypothetical protein